MNETIRRALKTYFYSSIVTLSSWFVLFFRLFNSLRNKKKVLVYTDSRGFEITKIWNTKNPFSSYYIKNLILNYSCTVLICPEKHTSILDFLDYYDRQTNTHYDYVILHCGIVDFSPRPQVSFEEMYNAKTELVKKYEIEKYISIEERLPGPQYEGEDTFTFLNLSALNEKILPKLKRITNLIYIGANRVILDWNGSYWKPRPENINDLLVLDHLVRDNLEHTIDLSTLTDNEIRTYTSDNIHYTEKGFRIIHGKLTKLLDAI